MDENVPAGVSQAWVHAISWAVAAELVRRHPQCFVAPNHEPFGLDADRLWVATSPGEGRDVEVWWSLNRAPGGAIHVGPGLEIWSDAPWERYLASKNTEAFCDELDRALERSPASVDDITPAGGAARVLSYRFIAAALQSSLTSSTPLHCVSVTEPEFGGDVIPPPFILSQLQRIPDAVGDSSWLETASWWLLTSPGEAVALVHDGGSIWTVDAQYDLPVMYAASNERLAPIVAGSLKRWLD